MPKKDYYEILGVSKNATEAEIKSAYKKLAKKYHPDVNKEAGAEAKFKETGEAYQVLFDAQKRAAYDRLGRAAFDQAQKSGGFGTAYRGADFDFSDIFSGGFRDPFEIFEEFFGASPFGFGTARPRQESAGSDLLYELILSFDEAVHGIEKEISYPRQGVCPACQGTGSQKGSRPQACPECEGRGRVRRATQTFLGSLSTIITCPTCGGGGEVIANPCQKCRGQGSVRENKKLKINVPAGVDSGDRLRFASEGNAGERGAKSGDLYVQFIVKLHPIFKRQGSDIYLDLPISFSQATLGDVIEVPTIDGQLKLKIPAGTQSGTQFRLKGKGVPYLGRGGRGDEYVRVQLKTPTQLSSQEKKLFEELKNLESQPKSFFNQFFA